MRPSELAGAGVSGRTAARALVEPGVRMTVTDADPARLADLPDGTCPGDERDVVPPGAALVATDCPEILAALARHAPEVPVAGVESGDDGPMLTAVARAAALARPGDVVLLAPAAASRDQFVDYAGRWRAFAAAVVVAALPGRRDP